MSDKKIFPKVTFVLSSITRSGGSRVTIEMANRLLEKGFFVRIAVRNKKVSFMEILRKKLKNLWLACSGADYTDWGFQYRGKLISFNNLNEVDIEDGEIVIAVGTKEIKTVQALKKNIIKIRYCHGLAATHAELTEKAWQDPMITLAVSQTLVPELEQYSGQKVNAVVPNGIRTDQYFDMDLKRDGIGMMYSAHYTKSPKEALEVIRRIKEQWTDIPLYIFGVARRPPEIPKEYYWRYPSIEKTRELYSRSKVWLSISRSEGFGLPILEAMACGAAVVCTENHGSREIVENGRNGILVSPGDIEDVVNKIDFLLSNESIRADLVKNSKETVSMFNWDKAVNKMAHVLISLSDKWKSTIAV
ncbi:glycosyltransferase family 4 protein [Marispirochaeta aestuarii]|uniref:glycosyltransferase family 4 protein n=1 Tax=Marispirochaeta aestuarii TaxID=1963862 RepID=UPI0029C6E640|nr:glycosyltransferase family 4 protein [Marispirochaeta aestuarii]